MIDYEQPNKQADRQNKQADRQTNKQTKEMGQWKDSRHK
jgi:hypothetical protein